MAYSAKDVLRSKSSNGKTSDGSNIKGKDLPPTPEDAKMTIKHTSESIPYNMNHAVDHIESMVKQLKRLCDYDKTLAKRLATHICEELYKIYKEVEEYK